MSTCFVIQPFDSGKFDKRFADIYKPAIEAAGLEAYRVDKDPSVSIPIDSIEDGIRQAAVCLADITADNPNVWYELGYAFALGRPIVMVCSDERTGKKYPFDIQHRSIIPYQADSPSDFEKLKESLTTRIKALVKKGETLQKLSEADPLTPVEGLTQAEILVLAVVAGSSYLPSNAVSAFSAKRDAERAGVTNMGFNIGIRRLSGKRFIELVELWDEHSGEPYDGIKVTDSGWSWIEDNESKFVLHRSGRNDADNEFAF
jgi:Nucleoside 2-deoxyribosyltransferase